MLAAASQALTRATSVGEITATVSHLVTSGLAPAATGLILLDEDGRRMRRELPQALPASIRSRWMELTERLRRAASDLGAGPVGSVLDAVLDHMVDTDPADDVAVLAVRIG